MAFNLKDFNKLASAHGLILRKYYGYFAWDWTEEEYSTQQQQGYMDLPPSVHVAHFCHLRKENWLNELNDGIEHLGNERLRRSERNE